MFVASIALLSLLGQEAHMASQSGEAKAKAKAQVLLKQGAQHYRRAEFADALTEFQAAYGIFPSPKLLLNIGQCSHELGRPVEALQAFERFLAEAHDAPERVLAEARQSVEELSTQVGKLQIECPLSGAEIKLDGKQIGVAPIKDSVRVTAGRHQLLALHEGMSPATATTYVLAGTVETVVLRPRAMAEESRRQRASLRDAFLIGTGVSNATGPEDRGWLMGRTWTWVATGSAVLFAGGATAAGLVMRSKFNAVDHSCGRSSGESYTGCKSSDLATIDTWKNTANVLWGLSAAAALTAGVLFYVEGRGVEVSPTVGPVLGLAASMRY
ncbi:MAG TPA: tetratricopeptide repeat protein [Polyangia bacterium]